MSKNKICINIININKIVLKIIILFPLQDIYINQIMFIYIYKI